MAYNTNIDHDNIHSLKLTASLHLKMDGRLEDFLVSPLGFGRSF